MKTAGNLFPIVRKELRGFLDSPTAYIALVIFLVAWEYLFFKNAFLIGEASLRPLFDSLPWFFLILIPALTMGSVSQEKNEGTLEWLLTHPVREGELLLGKFLAGLIFVLVALLFSLPIAGGFALFGSFDWGTYAAQGAASLLLGSVFLALGIFLSSLFKSQVAALLASAAAIFFLIIVQAQWVSNSLPLGLGNILERVSASTHFVSMARGVITLSDVLYFFTATAALLGLAYLQLIKPKYGNQKQLYRSWQLGVALLIGSAVFINVLGDRIPGRADLTQNDLYTLSPGTQKTLEGLNDIVRVTLYASDDLPADYGPIERDVRDILRDYEDAGKGKVILSQKNPSRDADIEAEATGLGIIKGQFNVIGQEELQVKSGYFGIAVASGSKHEVIPFVQSTSDLEYQLTSFITKLTRKEDAKKKVYFLSGHGEKMPTSDYQIWSTELEKQYFVDTFAFRDTPLAASQEASPTPAPAPAKFPEDAAVLVIAGPKQEFAEDEAQQIAAFLENGGSVLFLVDQVEVDPQMMSGMPVSENASDLLSDYGITINDDLAYDLAANVLLTFRDGQFAYQQPYPFFIKALPNENASQLSAVIPGLVLPWTSSLTIDDTKLQAKGWQSEKHFLTTDRAGTQKAPFNVAPQQALEDNGSERLPLAVSAGGPARQDGKSGRLIVVGDSDFLTDQSFEMLRAPENIGFGIEAIAFLAQEDSLASIKLKERQNAPLVFGSEQDKLALKFGNLALAVLLPFAVGMARLQRRRRLQRFSFSGLPQ